MATHVGGAAEKVEELGSGGRESQPRQLRRALVSEGAAEPPLPPAPPPQWVPQWGLEVREVRRPSSSGLGPGWRPQVLAGGLVRNRVFTIRKHAAHAALRSDWRMLSARRAAQFMQELEPKVLCRSWVEDGARFQT